MRDTDTNESDSDRQRSSGEAVEWEIVADRSVERVDDPVGEIIEAVAAAEEVPATTITSPPLFEAINIFALEELFFKHPNGGSNRICSGHVQFRYRGFRVTVTSERRVTVAAPVHNDAPE